MNRSTLEQQYLLLREDKIRKSRKSFWEFCKTLYPSFYKEEGREHLRLICNVMQGLYEGTLINEETGKPFRKMVLSVPPRHGKTFTKDNFILWLMGQEPSRIKVLSASYSKALSLISSRTIRNKINSEKTNPLHITYNDIFPGTNLSDDNAAVEQWTLDGAFFTYKAVSIGSSVTGMGANVMIADDLIADSFVANSPTELDKIYSWFFDTFASREEQNGITILVGTMWSNMDYLNRILRGPDKDDYFVIKLQAHNEETGEMLCSDLLSQEQFEYLQRNMAEDIFMANYQAVTLDQKNKLYNNLKQYEVFPSEESIRERICLVDPADSGDDSLVAIFCVVTHDNDIYIEDVLMTKENMDHTQGKIAELLTKHNTRTVHLESNSAGRLFSSNIKNELIKRGNRFTTVKIFVQKKNKESRIFTYAHVVERSVFFPINWRFKFPEYYTEMNSYKRTGNNKHDDAPDCTTMVVEHVFNKGTPQNISAADLGL